MDPGATCFLSQPRGEAVKCWIEHIKMNFSNERMDELRADWDNQQEKRDKFVREMAGTLSKQSGVYGDTLVNNKRKRGEPRTISEKDKMCTVQSYHELSPPGQSLPSKKCAALKCPHTHYKLYEMTKAKALECIGTYSGRKSYPSLMRAAEKYFVEGPASIRCHVTRLLFPVI